MAEKYDRRICGTRTIKYIDQVDGDGRRIADLPARHAAKLHIAEHRAAVARAYPAVQALLANDARFPNVKDRVTEPLFNGVVVVAAIDFKVEGQDESIALSEADILQVIAYLKLAVKPIRLYVGQYGSTTIDVQDAPVRFEAEVPSNATFDGDAVKAWVNDIRRKLAANLRTKDVCIIVLNPPELTNVAGNRKERVYGYHGFADVPFCFVNVRGRGLQVSDEDHFFALPLSHEVAEMAADPRVGNDDPEICDACSSNFQDPYIAYFDADAVYIDTRPLAFGPPPGEYAFFISAVTTPDWVTARPAPASACRYAPPDAP
jgi:hypothetical protein